MIMHVAKGLFEEKGIDNVTFNEIAEKADVCRTTVFNYFATMEDLVLALCEQEVKDIEEHCDDSKLSGEMLIVAMFSKLIEDTANYPALVCQLTSTSIMSEKEQKSVAKIEEIVDKGLFDMGVPKARRNEVVLLLMGVYYGMVNHYLLHNMKFDVKKMKKEFAAYMNKILTVEGVK